jgi:hypothetical protein
MRDSATQWPLPFAAIAAPPREIWFLILTYPADYQKIKMPGHSRAFLLFSVATCKSPEFDKTTPS